jgi:hypothetical protein
MTKTKRVSPRTTKLIVIFLWLTIASYFPFLLSHFLDDGDQLDPEVSRLIQAAPSQELYPDADVIYLLDEDIEEVFDDGSSKSTVHQVFKIVSESGIDYAECEIGYTPSRVKVSLIYARTITRDGRIIPLKKSAIKVVSPDRDFPDYGAEKELAFSIPGAEIGSIIDLKYVREVEPRIEGEFYSRFRFQLYNPALLSRYKIIVPEATDIKHLLVNPLKNHPSRPEILLSEGKKTYLWEYKNIPEILEEDDMPPTNEIAFHILVTTLDSWDEFFRWWNRKVQGKTKPDEGIKEKAVELTRGLSNTEEKIKALFDYVKREVRYALVKREHDVPRAAKDVFQTGYGDCKDKSTLLISMLKSVGIHAYLVLIPTTNIRNLIEGFPYPGQFNHIIVAIEQEDKYHFLDPTEKASRFDYLPEWDQNRSVIILKENEPIFAKTPLGRPEENAIFVKQQVKIKPTGSIDVDESRFFTGSKEISARYLLLDLSPKQIREELEELVRKVYPRARLLEYTHSDPLDFKKKFEMSLEYRAIRYCKKAGDFLIFKMPDIRKISTSTDKKKRRNPIFNDSGSYRKKEAEFNIPQGYDLYHLPEKVEIKNSHFEYRSSYQRKGQKVLYQAELITKALQIPVEEYPDYRNYSEMMDRSRKRAVLFREKK